MKNKERDGGETAVQNVPGLAGPALRRLPPECSAVRRRTGICGAADAVFAKRRFERRDAGLERFVLLAREARHLLDRLEILALDQSRSRKYALRLVRNSVSNSRRTPCATPAASFINRATSSKNRFVVCTMTASARAASPVSHT